VCGGVEVESGHFQGSLQRVGEVVAVSSFDGMEEGLLIYIPSKETICPLVEWSRILTTPAKMLLSIVSTCLIHVVVSYDCRVVTVSSFDGMEGGLLMRRVQNGQRVFRGAVTVSRCLIHIVDISDSQYILSRDSRCILHIITNAPYMLLRSGYSQPR